MKNSVGQNQDYRGDVGGGLVPVVAGTVAVVLVVLVFLSVFLWIREHKPSTSVTEMLTVKCVSSSDAFEPPSVSVSPSAEIGQQEELVDLQYASISFSKNPTDLYSNMRPTQPSRQKEQQDVTEYAAVNVSRAVTTKRTRSPETGEDPTAVYSTVNKSR
ncbi:B-cell receptor CD22-like [Xyrichtys novacula]|uniref:B-cell receptor CD22-like n=1 Tax=Xyrichtys novacula TaxID=13765 RepID=A0AAV1EVJ6_XYRNO|nr:B-cell receptor CD22-like [Xyrichtys novacula]